MYNNEIRDSKDIVSNELGPKSKESSEPVLSESDELFSEIVKGNVRVLSALLLFDSSVCCLKSTYTLSVFNPSEGVSQLRITGAEPNPLIPC